MYWWVDGVHFNVRLEQDRLCCLVIVGVRPDGTKELVALVDGYRESKESWAALLRSLRERGLAGPVLAVGDGALGFWAALRDVFPSTKEQRCWVHKTANCIDALPKRLQPQAKSAIQAIYNGVGVDDCTPDLCRPSKQAEPVCFGENVLSTCGVQFLDHVSMRHSVVRLCFGVFVVRGVTRS